ncbi:DegV family protein [Paeniglutamicibacter cryotolerans]|uniref:DegV family protein with EDD domain n=1 Tax=Paeniglutamicibacter cryotolerans TaxID=670079 RepID=A0A839QQV7_9MICC|nr:DegV family protein [Paeniglutamicibacter cryotolerans]MBB2997164.1 DegV family protein with EDD domain [Paeniglutamicibacter cryotolerans]
MSEPRSPVHTDRRDRRPAWKGLLASRRKAAGAVPVPAIGIVTDSAAALPAAWVRAHASVLRSVPMPVMIDGNIYVEGTDDVQTALALGLAMGKTVQTSRPAPGQLLRAYTELAEAGVAHIVSVHLSAKLSGTVDAARLAAEQSPVPVTVVDSRTVALAQGFAVMKMVDAAESGAGLATITALAQTAESNSIFFTVPSLDQLRRGGRIGAAAGMIGTLLAVKPILTMSGGQVIVQEKVRTHPRALARLVALARAEAAARGPGASLAVHYFGNLDQALEIVAELGGASAEAVFAQPVPAVLAAHTGAGVLAVAITSGAEPVTVPTSPVD